MQKVFIPIDGSAHSNKAVRFVSNFIQDHGHVEIHIANIVAKLGVWQGNVMEEKDIDGDQVKRGYQALASALEMFDESNIPYRVHIGQGDTAKVLIAMADRLECDFIVMGIRNPETKGSGIGPVARNLLSHSKVSVICVK